MNPYKIDKIPINNRSLDKRYALNDDRRDQIKNLKGKARVKEIAILFGVSESTVKRIFNPDKKRKSNWKKYYNKEKRRGYMKKYRDHKNKLFKQGLLKSVDNGS